MTTLSMDLFVRPLLFLPLLFHFYVTVTSHGGAHHHSSSRDSSVTSDRTGFHDNNVVRDTEHINEHLQNQAKVNVSAMSPEELEFHYFKLHDYDNNTMLDGLEIFKALTHLIPYDSLEESKQANIVTQGKTAEEIVQAKRLQKQRYYTDFVDNVLQEDDLNDDGYLSYVEYIIARRRGEAQEEKQRRQEDKHQNL